MTRPAILTDPEWHENALLTIAHLARTQPTVTSEDLRRHIDPPEHHSAYGNAFQAAYKAHLITPTGYRPSRDKSRRGGAIRVWELHESQKERAA